MDTKVVTTHLPIALARRIDGLAKQLRRSRSWIVIEALTEWVARQDGEGGRKPGFAEAPAGFETGTASREASRAVTSLKTLRQSTNLGDLSWQELRDAGRR